MARVLLIEPAKSPVTFGGEEVFLFEPLALEYLGAGLAPHHDVRLLDMRLDKRLQETFDAFRPDVVGITAYTVHVNGVKRLLETVKSWNPEVLTVVGGHHATIAPQDFAVPSVDLIVRGEGVLAFREIVERHERGQSLAGIPGVARVAEGEASDKGYPKTVDLDDLPFPDRSLTAGYRREYYSEWMRPLASIRTSKGCPFRCSFCALWKIAGGRYFRRRPERIVEELAGIEEEFVFFADDESLIDSKRMMALADRIEQAGLRKRYFLYGRSDTIARHPELLAAWRRVGLERVFVGLESFRDEDLGALNKGSTTGHNARAVRVLNELGIEVYASFILQPGFTREDFAALRAYCHRLDLRFGSFAVLTPLPGTDLWAETKDQLLTHDYDYFDFIHTLLPTTLPLEDFYAEYLRLLRRAFPVRNQIAFLRRYPLRELPALLAKARRLQRRLKGLHRDYEPQPGEGPAAAAARA